MPKVLVADDHPVTRKMLQSILTKSGYEVVPAQDGREAWDLLSRTADIRLAILDWMMPRIDGVEICRRLRNQYPASLIYVILLTARDGTEDITCALQAGANDYVTKPFVKEELLARLRAGERIVELQTQLTRAQKLESIGQLASGMAHEINTPTQYLSNNAQFLARAFTSVNEILRACAELLEEKQQESSSHAPGVDKLARLLVDLDVDYLTTEIPRAIKQSIEGIDHIARIITALKHFAQPGVGRRTRVNLNEAVEDTVLVTRNRWQPVAELVTRLDPALPPVTCFAAEINQVILQLITNAADAIAEAAPSDEPAPSDAGPRTKGRITITTTSAGDWVELRVTDTGTGIPQEIRSRIFDPFFSTRQPGPASGQGLATAHAIVVARHGGTIDFVTEPGHGTTFVVRLPVAAPENNGPAPA